jgi:uncharacterized MAPEG superfamily protein
MLAGYLAWLGLTHAVSADPAATEAMRMGAACAALLPTAALLAAMVATQMIGRATSAAIDPTAGDDNRFLQVNQRVLTNTVEQLAILVPALLALAAVTSPAAMPRVVALALVFALARLVFWIGYLCHPVLRAAGMAPSMAVSLATLGAAAVAWLR